MLSGKRDPTIVPWPGLAKPVVPLGVRYDEGSFKWGNEIKPGAEADTLFGMCVPNAQDVDTSAQPMQQVIQELYRKRGRSNYHFRWSLYRDLQSDSTKSLERFLHAVKLHILRVLERTYSTGKYHVRVCRIKLKDIYSTAYSAMEMQTCAVIPSYLTQDQEGWLKQQLLAEFGSDSLTMHFITQPQASLMCLAEETGVSMDVGDLLTVCHMEEEITTISRFVVKMGSPNLELRKRDTSIIVVGSLDIGESYQGYLEEQLDGAISAFDFAIGGSGSRIGEEIVKLKYKFLDGIHGCNARRSKLLRFRCNVTDGSPARMHESRLMINGSEMRERIFNPTLNAVFDRLNRGFGTENAKRYILFSGVLGECPYVHAYMENRFGSNVGVLGTNDEQPGSGFFLDNRPSVVTIQTQHREHIAAVLHAQGSRLSHVRIIEDRLDDLMQAITSTYQLHSLAWKYEMILSERITRHGFANPGTKATVLSVVAIQRRLGIANRAIGHCAQFAEGYADEVKRQLDPADPRQHFSAMHLAAAAGDSLAVRIALAARYSVHEAVRESPLKHFENTPLHLYAWYSESPNECLDLLINAGAVGLSPRAIVPGPVHIAASKVHHRLLRGFERYYRSFILDTRPALLMLAFDANREETARYLLEVGTSLSLENPVVVSPLTGKYVSRSGLLCSALAKGWAHVATSIINQRGAGPQVNGIKPPLLYSDATGQEAMVRLLIRWADRDPDAQDELGQTPLSWAARLGYEAVVRLLMDWEEVGVNSRDQSGCTPLAWAATCGHEGVVQILAERLDIEIDCKDRSGRTPLSHAAGGGYERVVQLLLEKGANIADNDSLGEQALHYAASHGHEPLVRLLIEMGADVYARDEEGMQALHTATRGGSAA
ncbi:MAG: hypothetical protein M1839_003092 [Geoglossum umbratile]|nr:MAG: hypothetical protein M1839_003092 [Geoglossum umbratile]